MRFIGQEVIPLLAILIGSIHGASIRRRNVIKRSETIIASEHITENARVSEQHSSEKLNVFTERISENISASTEHIFLNTNVSTEHVSQKVYVSTEQISQNAGKECNCGSKSRGCFFDDEGVKICTCYLGYSQIEGICVECDCGEHYYTCDIDQFQKKICSCRDGYSQTNGKCQKTCDPGLCYNGDCEDVGKGFKECRCNEGYTGERCNDKIQTNPIVTAVLFTLGFIFLALMVGCVFYATHEGSQDCGTSFCAVLLVCNLLQFFLELANA